MRRTSYSAAGTVAPGLFPDALRMHGTVATYFDTAVVITALVLLGQVLELRAARPDEDGHPPAARTCAADRRG